MGGGFGTVYIGQYKIGHFLPRLTQCIMRLPVHLEIALKLITHMIIQPACHGQANQFKLRPSRL